jgi:hypothetical protein
VSSATICGLCGSCREIGVCSEIIEGGTYVGALKCESRRSVKNLNMRAGSTGKKAIGIRRDARLSKRARTVAQPRGAGYGSCVNVRSDHSQHSRGNLLWCLRHKAENKVVASFGSKFECRLGFARENGRVKSPNDSGHSRKVSSPEGNTSLKFDRTDNSTKICCLVMSNWGLKFLRSGKLV